MRRLIAFLKKTEQSEKWIKERKGTAGEEEELQVVENIDKFMTVCREEGKLREQKKRPEALFLTDDGKAAGAAAEASLPVIYLEHPQEAPVWKADLTVFDLEEADWLCISRVFKRHYGLPWTICETKRLLVRESVEEDFEALYRLGREEAENPYILPMSGNKEVELEKFRAYLRFQYPFYGYGLYTIEEKASKAVIGRAGFQQREYEKETYLELGYLIGEPYRQRGYAREACMALGEALFDLTGEERAYLFCHPGNLPSVKTAKSLQRARPDRFFVILTRKVW